MASGTEKLREDLDILQAMVEEMPAYLSSAVLFWPMLNDRFPRLTPGAYLLRQHRLLALPNLLSDAQQRELQEAVDRFHRITADRVVRFEEKSNRDLRARLHEWGQHLDDFQEHDTVPLAHYANAVQARATVSALVQKMEQRPFRLAPVVAQKVQDLDHALRALWKEASFVWPPEWIPAYPRPEYWWLYGQVRGRSER
jgi:hypothetical protein